MYDREYLSRAIPNATPDSVGDGTLEQRTSFADGYNLVLDVLRAEALPGIGGLTDEQVNSVVHVASETWSKYCEQQGDVTRTLAWLRSELTQR